MKCEYCSKEPIRCCLFCGVFYCDSHGTYVPPERTNGQPFRNSMCKRCGERTSRNMKNFGAVFMVIGLGLLILGGIMSTTTGEPAFGLIFLLQAIVFGTIGAVFRFGKSTGKKPF